MHFGVKGWRWRLRGRRWRLRGRGAEAGGILGVNTPHFLEDPKKWKLERVGNKKLGGGKFFIFRRWKEKILEGAKNYLGGVK